MAKSMRSKREKRLRAIRRELVEPIYEKKDAAKLAVQEAALAAPKLPVKASPFAASDSMDIAAAAPEASSAGRDGMDLEMGDSRRDRGALRPMGKKMKKKIKMGKRKHQCTMVARGRSEERTIYDITISSPCCSWPLRSDFHQL